MINWRAVGRRGGEKVLTELRIRDNSNFSPNEKQQNRPSVIDFRESSWTEQVDSDSAFKRRPRGNSVSLGSSQVPWESNWCLGNLNRQEFITLKTIHREVYQQTQKNTMKSFSPLKIFVKLFLVLKSLNRYFRPSDFFS